ncbi:MAG: hypothetical protein Q9M16_09305 [Mariprofundus sp.]|nr:hypothetical protein [Mariprofundus sp.]
MWYEFLLGKISRSWPSKDQDRAILELKIHMMYFEKKAAECDATGIEVALREMGFEVKEGHVKPLWERLNHSKSIDVGHAMEALAEDISDHVSLDRRRAVLSQLWPASSRQAIPDKNEEAIFDRVASLLGFEDKNFLDSCIKHRSQRNWELSESEVYCVVAELLICMMWADGKKGLQESQQLCLMMAHGFQMDSEVVHQMFAGLDAMEKASDQPKGFEQFEQQRQRKLDMLVEITRLEPEDVEHKFHVLIDMPRLDSMNLERRLKLLVEKLRYSLDDYGYERLLEELQDIARVDGDLKLSENSVIVKIQTLLAAVKENATA